jgi:hypothetical protein
MDDLMIRIIQLGREGYACSQVMVLLALEARGNANPDLVRGMAGLAYGCGDGRGTCGTLTAGCCLLALLAREGEAEPRPPARLAAMQQELVDWFEARAAAGGGFTCNAIVGAGGPAAAQAACGTLVADTYRQVLALLEANGFDPLAGN